MFPIGATQTEGIDVRSVGNSLVLKETALIEAFNLKAAIECVRIFDMLRARLPIPSPPSRLQRTLHRDTSVVPGTR